MGTDQPTDKPKTLDETKPSKRILLKYRLPGNNDYNALNRLFNYTLHLPDFLVQHGSFRPKELRKAAKEEKNEERILEREKAKKAKRDAELAALDAKAQKKYLEKEQTKEMR